MDRELLRIKRAEELALEKYENKPQKTLPDSKKGAKNNKVFAVITGVFAGFLNGLFGGGGGMVVVPMLTSLLKLEEKVAHATAILIILPLSAISSVFYLSFGSLELNSSLPIALGVLAGGLIGALLLKKLPAKKIVGIFYFAMLISGIKMLIF